MIKYLKDNPTIKNQLILCTLIYLFYSWNICSSKMSVLGIVLFKGFESECAKWIIEVNKGGGQWRIYSYIIEGYLVIRCQ